MEAYVLIYVHTDFEYESLSGFEQRTAGWEQLFVKIRHKNPNSKKYIMGNVYRVLMKLLPLVMGLPMILRSCYLICRH